jgi:hypothetical protein
MTALIVQTRVARKPTRADEGRLTFPHLFTRCCPGCSGKVSIMPGKEGQAFLTATESGQRRGLKGERVA